MHYTTNKFTHVCLESCTGRPPQQHADGKTDDSFIQFHTNLLEHSVSLTDELANVGDNSLFDLHQLVLLDLGIAQTLSVLKLCLHHLEETGGKT